MGRGSQEVARAIRRASHDIADRQPSPAVGIVRSVSPLRVELTESSLVLDEDDLSLGQNVRRYGKDKGLSKGDSLALIPIGNGDWIAHDVLSQSEPPENLESKKNKPKVTGSRDANDALKSLLRVLEEAGLIQDETSA